MNIKLRIWNYIEIMFLSTYRFFPGPLINVIWLQVIRENITSVSYTHLDVYKRQEVNSVIRKDLGNMTLNIDQFVKDAMTEIELTPAKIRTFSMEYEEIHRVEHEKEEQFASMRSKNEALQTDVKKLECDYTSLNREHVLMANELIKNRLNIAAIEKENVSLKMEVLKVKKRIDQEIKEQKAQGLHLSLIHI